MKKLRDTYITMTSQLENLCENIHMLHKYRISAQSQHFPANFSMILSEHVLCIFECSRLLDDVVRLLLQGSVSRPHPQDFKESCRFVNPNTVLFVVPIQRVNYGKAVLSLCDILAKPFSSFVLWNYNYFKLCILILTKLSRFGNYRV